MIHVGIDVHSRNMTLVAINDNAKLIVEEKRPTTPENLSRFFAQISGPVASVKIAQPTSPLVQVIGISTKENRKET